MSDCLLNMAAFLRIVFEQNPGFFNHMQVSTGLFSGRGDKETVIR